MNVGFRKVEIKNKRILVNGQPVIFKGTNRHEHNAECGHTLTKEDMLKDIFTMKKFNINAVRTCHYPDMPQWYDLCDEYGIYVMNEANIETHGFGVRPDSKIANNPDFDRAHFDRVERMVRRDKNHPCIFSWSMGNEFGEGPGIIKAANWTRKYDPTRPTHCESSSAHGTGIPADINSRMYCAPQNLDRAVASAPSKPFLLCEYTHAMGNSNGTLKEYWDKFYEDNNVQGGFVWDWMDQGLTQKVPEKFRESSGRDEFYAYGGWWEDARKVSTNRDFCMNGLVDAGGKPHPGLHILKYWQQNVKVDPIDVESGKFSIINRFYFTNLADIYTGKWTITSNGRPLREGVFNIDLEPQQTAPLALNLPNVKAEPGTDYYVTLSFVLKDDAPYAPAGYEMAFEQFKMNTYINPEPLDTLNLDLVKVQQKENVIIAGNANFIVSFNKETGLIEHYMYGSLKLISKGPKPYFWRSPTNNDRGAGLQNKLKIWKDAGDSFKVDNFKWDLNGNVLTIDVLGKIENVEADYNIQYKVYGNGDVVVNVDYKPTKENPMMFRFGMLMEVPVNLNKMVWFGRGPQPTCPGKTAQRIGIFNSTVDQQWVDYCRPQENGNKTDVRWAAFTEPDSSGLLVVGMPNISLGAKRFTDAQMQSSDYSFKMTKSDNILVNIDLKQMGVGGINSWGTLPLEEYRVPDGPYSYSFRLAPAIKGNFNEKCVYNLK